MRRPVRLYWCRRRLGADPSNSSIPPSAEGCARSPRPATAAGTGWPTPTWSAWRAGRCSTFPDPPVGDRASRAAPSLRVRAHHRGGVPARGEGPRRVTGRGSARSSSVWRCISICPSTAPHDAHRHPRRAGVDRDGRRGHRPRRRGSRAIGGRDPSASDRRGRGARRRDRREGRRTVALGARRNHRPAHAADGTHPPWQGCDRRRRGPASLRRGGGPRRVDALPPLPRCHPRAVQRASPARAGGRRRRRSRVGRASRRRVARPPAGHRRPGRRP